ncbi:hypothetical protein PhCBS80983_g00801 [Powellomyces hirtus]|uniref:TmcB/TmcC TPR repeats domain-containing protein n=1 Tax=Powellomyces hirtus TaxID=109895 RepID=A0A507EF91_9FUNG|nr:hypothetical protein PhCBS80983_g00801 [Powellomyces hirtus]
MAPTIPSGPLRDQSADLRVDTTLDSIIRSCKEALMGILLVINKNDHEQHPAWDIIKCLVEHCQDLMFPISVSFFPWQSEISWLRRGLEWTAPEDLISQSSTVFNVLISALGLTLTLRTALGLFATILYIPSLAIFVSSISFCGPGGVGPPGSGPVCWGGSHFYASMLTLPIIVIFIILVLAVAATLFEPDPKKEDIESRCHSRLDLLYIGCQTVLTLMQITLRGYTDTTSSLCHWLMAGTCVVTSMSLACATIWYLPYYSFKYSMFRTALNFNFAWASLCCVYNLIRPGSDIGILYVVLIPAVMVFSGFVARARRHSIESGDPQFMSPTTLELKIRFRLEKANLLFRRPPKNNITLTEGSPGDLNYGTTQADRANVEKNAKHKEREILDELSTMFSQGFNRHQKSCRLRLYSGQFQLLQMGNKAQCLALHEKAAAMQPSLDEAFMIFRRRRTLHERYMGGDVIDFIAFEQNMQHAKKHEQRAVHAVTQFWAELLRRNPSFERLQAHGVLLTAAASSAQQSYGAMLRLSPHSANVYRLYGNFLINILNDVKQGQALLQHADELEDSGDKGDGEGSNHEDTFDGDATLANTVKLNEDSAMFTISGDEESLGLIENVNQPALKMFGYRKGEILHKNISIIIPSPFCEMHDYLLKQYLDTGRAKVIDRPRSVLAVHSTGYLMTVSLLVKQVTEEGGKQAFLGVLNRIPDKINQEYAITNPDLSILHFTRGCTTLFGTPPVHRSLVHVAKPNLSEWLPDMNPSRLGECMGGQKLKFLVDAAEPYDVYVSASEVELHGSRSFIFRLSVHHLANFNTGGVEGQHEGEPSAGGCPFRKDGRQQQNISRAFSVASETAMPLAFSAHSLNDDSENEMPKTQNNNKAPKVDNDDSYSLTSGGSQLGSSGNSQLRRMVALRTVVATGRLRWITASISLCLALSASLAIGQNRLYHWTFKTASKRLTHTRMRGDACFHALSVVDGVRSLQLSRLPSGPLPGVYEEDKAMEQLRKSALALQNVVRDLSPASDDPFPLIVAVETLAGTINMSLMELVNTVVSQILFILAAPANDSGVPMQMASLLSNAGTIMLDGLNASAWVLIKAEGPVEPETVFGISCLGPILYLVFFIGITWPLYCLIEENRKSVLKVFLTIPKEVVKGIYEAHLEQSKAFEEDEDNEPDMHLNDRDHPGGEGLPNLIDSLSSGRMKSSDQRSRSTKRLPWWLAIRDQHMMIPKAGIIFCLCLAYFISGGALIYNIVQEGGAEAGQVYWATQQLALVRHVDLVAREAYIAGQNIAPPSFQAPSLPSLIATLGRVHHGLIYGSTSMGTPLSLTSSNPDLTNVMLNDACLSSSPQDCNTFSNGILSHGLHSALSWYSQNALLLSGAHSSLTVTQDPLSLIMFLRAMDHVYLLPVLEFITDFFEGPFFSQERWFATYHLTFTVIFVFAMAASYVFLFRPLITQLDADIRRTHVMLFMIPTEVFEQTDMMNQWREKSQKVPKVTHSAETEPEQEVLKKSALFDSFERRRRRVEIKETTVSSPDNIV